MKIMNVEVKNFRCLKAIDIPFDNMTALVGRNGTGKSSVLKAIDVFFNVSYPITIEDYYNKYIDEQIEINIIFGDFTENEKELFHRYISNNKLIISKRIPWDEGRVPQVYYTKSMQIPEFAGIKEIKGLSNQQTAIRELIGSGKFEGLTGSFRSAEQGLEILDDYTEAHPELTQLTDSIFPLMGARNVGGGSIDNFTRFVLLPAVKEATEEIGDRSPIGQLIDTIVLTQIRNRDDLMQFEEDINKQISKTYSPDNLGGLEELGKDISNVLQIYAPTSELKINWGEATPVKVGLPQIIYSLIEDNFEGDVSKKGHGLQRALILTLIEYLAKIPPEIEGEGRARVDLIIALEEPEIYLHPSRCRYLAKILSELAERGERDPSQNRIQIIYSTHSPYFVGLDRFDSIRILRKSQTRIPYTTRNFYTLDEAADIYAKICDKPRIEITREHFRVKTVPLMKIITNEGFFADMVILCEGPSDIGVIWKLQEMMGKEWEKMSIAIIPCRGNAEVLKAGIIFKGLGIPTYIIFDLDSESSIHTKRLLRFLDQPPECPEEFVHRTWACNKDNLEEVLEKCVGEENYQRIWQKVETELEYPRARKKKNEEVYSKFTEIAYETEIKLEPLERIVNAITDYYQSETRELV